MWSCRAIGPAGLSVVMRKTRLAVCASVALVLAACTPEHNAAVPGDAADDQPFAAIAETAVLHLLGTEPFWGGEISSGQLIWTTPENPAGTRAPVARFAGRGGLSFSGQLDEQPIDLMITPASCSDGMSDRTYPYVVTVTLGDQQLQGCGWSDQQGYSGAE